MPSKLIALVIAIDVILNFVFFVYLLSFFIDGLARSAIEETIQDLTYDDKVRNEKVGVSNYFWAFPSEAPVGLKTQLESYETKINDIDQQIIRMEKRIEQAKENRQSDDREQKMQDIQILEQRYNELSQELEKYADSDPAKLDLIKNGIQVAQESHERWTDTIFAIAKIVKERKGMSNSEFFKAFGLSGELDYIEDDDKL